MLIPFIIKILLVYICLCSSRTENKSWNVLLAKITFHNGDNKSLESWTSLSFLPNGCCVLTYLFNHEIYLDTHKRFSEKYPLNVNHGNRQTSICSHRSPDTLSSHIYKTHLSWSWRIALMRSLASWRTGVCMQDKLTKQEWYGPPRVYFYRHGRRKWNGKASLHYAWPERKREAEKNSTSSTAGQHRRQKNAFTFSVFIYV